MQRFKTYIEDKLNMDFNNWLDSNAVEKINKEIKKCIQ